MNSEIKAAEKAELIQSVKALLIPLSLFLACVIMAAGTFLIYNREPLGWAFATTSAVIIITAIIALIRFQNKHRARGILKHGTDSEDLAESKMQQNSEVATEIEEPSNVVEFKPTADKGSAATSRKL